jgi:hypothetical protein
MIATPRKKLEFFSSRPCWSISPCPEASQFAKDNAQISTPLMSDSSRVPIRPRPMNRTRTATRPTTKGAKASIDPTTMDREKTSDVEQRVDVDPSVNEYCEDAGPSDDGEYRHERVSA